MAEKKDKKTKLNNNRMLSVYGYIDYRIYLRDYYEFKKQGAAGYSYRIFSKEAGFSSPNFLKLVIEGKRNLGQKAAEKVARALSLDGQQMAYFLALVEMNQAKSDLEKEEKLEKLKKLTPFARRRELHAGELKYLGNWLYPVLREMLELDNFADDPKWIAKKLFDKASSVDVEAAMNFLLKQGFIARDADGKLKQAEDMVLSSDEISSLAVRNYHRQMLDQAKDLLEVIPMSERELWALTFVLPSEAIAEFKFKIKTFRRDLHAWAVEISKKSKSDSVIQLNLQMYPQTKKEDK